MSKKKTRIVQVEWLDAASLLGSASNAEDLSQVESCHTISVGYLLKRNKKGVYLSTDMLDGEYQGAIHFIPGGMLKDMKDLGIVAAPVKKPRKPKIPTPPIEPNGENVATTALGNDVS